MYFFHFSLYLNSRRWNWIVVKLQQWNVNSFYATGVFLNPLIISENQRISIAFRGYTIPWGRSVAWNNLTFDAEEDKANYYKLNKFQSIINQTIITLLQLLHGKKMLILQLANVCKYNVHTQLTFNFSKLAIETLEKMWNMFKAINKNTRTTSLTLNK